MKTSITVLRQKGHACIGTVGYPGQGLQGEACQHILPWLLKYAIESIAKHKISTHSPAWFQDVRTQPGTSSIEGLFSGGHISHLIWSMENLSRSFLQYWECMRNYGHGTGPLTLSLPLQVL